MSSQRIVRLLAVTLCAACTHDPVSPASPVLRPASPSLSRVASARLSSTMRAAPGATPLAYGAADLYVNLLPPSPCAPAPRSAAGFGQTDVAVCGRIYNPGGATLASIAVHSDVSGRMAIVAPFLAALPPSPCRVYDVTGTVRVADALAADFEARPFAYVLRADGTAPGSSTPTLVVGGRLDGSAWGPVGAIREASPSVFGADACHVTIRPG